MFSEQILRTTRNAQRVRQGNREWFRFENLANGEVAVYIYDEIGFFGVTASDFLGELRGITSNALNVHLNSPGGDVFDGIAIYNGLKQHRAKVNIVVDSIAASIASVIAMAGDTVTMTRGSMMMIHEPFALVIGDANDMRKQAEALDLMGQNIASIYADRAGGSVEEWRGRMTAETWYSGADAVAAGLADAVAGESQKNTFDLSIFRNGPSPVQAEEPLPVVPDWRHEARVAVAAAQMEVLSGYGN